MALFLDIAPIAIFLFFVVLFSVRGFLKSIISFGKTLIAAVVAYIFGPIVAKGLATGIFHDKITNFVFDKLSSLYDGATETFDLSQVFEKLNTDFAWIKNFGVNVETLESQYGSMTSASSSDLYSLSETIANPLIKISSNVVGYLGVFVVALLACVILVFVVKGISDIIEKIPVVGKLNHILGGAFGVIMGVIVVVLAVYVADAIMNYAGAMSDKFDYQSILDKTKIFVKLKELNLIQYIKTR